MKLLPPKPIFIFISIAFLITDLSTSQVINDFMLVDSSSYPFIKIDHESKIHVLYGRDQGDLYYTLLDSAWSEIKPSTEIRYGRPYTSRLGLDSNSVVAVWDVQTPMWESYIKGQLISINGDIINDGITINQYAAGSAHGPDLTFINDTTIFVVWTGDGQSGFGIYGQFLNDSLFLIGQNILLSDYESTSYYPVCPSVDSQTDIPNIIVVWIDDRLVTPAVFGRLFNIDGTPQDSSFLVSEVNNMTYCWYTQVKVNETDGLHVAYGTEIADTVWNIYYRQIDNSGNPITNSIKINDLPAWGASDIEMDLDSNGNIMVVWESINVDNSRRFIAGQRINPDGDLIGTNIKISHLPESLNHGFPTVDLHNGLIYTAWSSWDSVSSIWANVIDFYNPPVQVEYGKGQFPDNFSLSQNYPNPFNPTTTIQYDLPMAGPVRLEVYNLLGQKVMTLVNGHMNAGSHRVRLDSAQLSSGIYFYTLETSEYRKTKKLIVLN